VPWFFDFRSVTSKPYHPSSHLYLTLVSSILLVNSTCFTSLKERCIKKHAHNYWSQSLTCLRSLPFFLPHTCPPSLPTVRLIMIAKKKTVYEKFPTPLINRLEKHFVLTSSVLTEGQLDVLRLFKEWIHQFSNVTTTSE